MSDEERKERLKKYLDLIGTNLSSLGVSENEEEGMGGETSTETFVNLVEKHIDKCRHSTARIILGSVRPADTDPQSVAGIYGKNITKEGTEELLLKLIDLLNLLPVLELPLVAMMPWGDGRIALHLIYAKTRIGFELTTDGGVFVNVGSAGDMEPIIGTVNGFYLSHLNPVGNTERPN